MGQDDRVYVVAAVHTLPRRPLQFFGRRRFPIGANPEQRRDPHQESLTTHAGHSYLHSRPGVEEAMTCMRCKGLLVEIDRKSTRLNSSHRQMSYAVFCFEKK